jgi:hypothetical protein
MQSFNGELLLRILFGELQIAKPLLAFARTSGRIALDGWPGAPREA